MEWTLRHSEAVFFRHLQIRPVKMKDYILIYPVIYLKHKTTKELGILHNEVIIKRHKEQDSIHFYK